MYIIIFDLDDTLIKTDEYNDNNLKLYPETLEVLENIKHLGFPMYVCSHRHNGDEVLEMFDLKKYFVDTCCESLTISKAPNMKKLIERNNLDVGQIIYFDDLVGYIRQMEFLGIQSYQINKKNGVTWELIENILEYNKCKNYKK